MKKKIFILFLLVFVGSFFYTAHRHFSKKNDPTHIREEEIQKRLMTLHPILEDQRVIAIVLGENVADHVERNLRSLFDQTYAHTQIIYIDNGSEDGTYEKVQAFVEKEVGRDHFLLMKMEQRKPTVEALYEVIKRCEPHEVIALIDGKDWLAHENVFDHLNCAYANSDVWMTYSRAVSYPDYQKVEGKLLQDHVLKEKKLRKEVKEELSPLVTFYAGFFHEIKLQDLLYEGRFIDICRDLAVELPLVEMGPEHILFMDEIMYVKNEAQHNQVQTPYLQKVAVEESYLRSLRPYSNLSHLKLFTAAPFHRYTSDVILFSEDSPLHLYACLESLFLKARDINDVYVFLKSSDQEFQRAYRNLQNDFEKVQFLNVCDYSGNDFKTLISKVFAIRYHASPFILIGEDHMIFKEPIRFHSCIEALEKIHGEHFFLGFGNFPRSLLINSGIYAWQLGEKGRNQEFTFSLCRKDLFSNLKEARDLSSFKQIWKNTLSSRGVSLFFEESRMFPIELEKESTLSKKKEWRHKFIEGLKIDLSSFSYEVQERKKGELPLVKRQEQTEEFCLD